MPLFLLEWEGGNRASQETCLVVNQNRLFGNKDPAAMILKKSVLFSLLSLCQLICAQNDSILRLDEVEVSDRYLKNFSGTQTVVKLTDSVLKHNQPSLTALLNYNSTIYFKENGPGMVSSPSFRGTTAQQTAVVWNGININSQFNGQTDFNAISAKDFDNVSIRSGGGSVLYGSSAIGGSVHLNSVLRYGSHFENDMAAVYGSFNTIGLNYQLDAGCKNVTVVASLSRNSSDNEFEVPSGRLNTNGQYYNTSANVGIGYRIDPKNQIKWFGYVFDGERHFSLVSPSDTRTKYRELSTRNLVEWTGLYGKFTSNAKAALITEHYHFYETLDTETPNFGKAQSVILKYDAAYSLTPDLTLSAVADFTHSDANGSDVPDKKRQVSSTALLLRHQVGSGFRYEIGIRKEITASYHSPLLFSAGMAMKFGEHYLLKWNGSRNFRVPTFNDLYWREGGNPDLRPESSFQTEIGNEFAFRKFRFSITGYLMNIDDMIQWLPGSTTVWMPTNVNRVRAYGVETALSFDKKLNRHNIALSGTYSYTVSKNQLTGFQLIYVPYHKATAALAWSWREFSADFQFLFNGEVFTRSDNNARYNLASYPVSNLSAAYGLGKAGWLTLGVGVLNLFDQRYQVVEGRWFPGRNYNASLTLKF